MRAKVATWLLPWNLSELLHHERDELIGRLKAARFAGGDPLYAAAKCSPYPVVGLEKLDDEGASRRALPPVLAIVHPIARLAAERVTVIRLRSKNG